MAKASFYVNDLKVKRKGDFLVIEARKKCKHGTVFDEVFLTVPAGMASLLNVKEQNHSNLEDNNKSTYLAERFKRFTLDN